MPSFHCNILSVFVFPVQSLPASLLAGRRRSAFNVNDDECCRRRGRWQRHGQYGGLGQQETTVPDELQHVAAGGTGTGVFGQSLSGRVHAGGVGPAVGPQGIQSGRKYTRSADSLIWTFPTGERGRGEFRIEGAMKLFQIQRAINNRYLFLKKFFECF